MTTAPSTIKPKSSAPNDIKLPDTLKTRIRMAANSIQSGMIVATSKLPRQFPSSRMRTMIT
jgi:hypothetical protein